MKAAKGASQPSTPHESGHRIRAGLLTVTRPHFLLVEDDEGVGKTLKKTSERWVDVTWVRNYDAAVAAFSKRSFSALITDMRLEGPSGFEVLEAFRKLHRRIPAMILTAYLEEADSTRACELGAQYVAKPITTLGLQRFIEEATPAPLPLPPASLGLSPAEQRVFGLLAGRFSNDEVARTLGISIETVKSHVKAIFGKLGVESRAEIPKYAGRGGTKIPL